jgi:hypothetical protein
VAVSKQNVKLVVYYESMKRKLIYMSVIIIVYYESIKREPKIRGIKKCRWVLNFNVSSFFFFRAAERYNRHATLWLSILQNERNQTIFTPQESPHYRLSFFLNTEEKWMSCRGSMLATSYLFKGIPVSAHVHMSTCKTHDGDHACSDS